jgi:protoporphyrinogen oxidase
VCMPARLGAILVTSAMKDVEKTSQQIGDAAGKRVVILGGGFAGLRVAHLLTAQGYDVSLIERSGRLGGMVQTFAHEWGGGRFLFDYGPHLFFRDYLDVYRELLGNDLLSISDCFRMYTENATLSYPLRPVELITRMNPLVAAAYVLDFAYHKLASGNSDDNLEAFMSKRFGKKLFNDFYAPYIEKCCGLPPGEVSVLWARERENVSGKSLGDNILKKIGSMVSSKVRERLTKANDPSAKQITAWYPRLGGGQLCDAMAAALNRDRVFLNSRIEEINVADNSVQSVVIQSGGKRQAVSGDYYVSTLPLCDLFGCFQPAFPGMTDVAGKLEYRCVRLVNLIIEKDRVLDCLELFSMNRRHIFKRVYEPKAMSDSMAPRGASSLCLEICCFPGDELARMAPDRLAARCVEQLIELKLLSATDEVKDSFVVDMPQAYPVYRKGMEVHRQKLLDVISAMDNLLTTGRQGLFRYHAMTNEVMGMADSVARFLRGPRRKEKAENQSQWGQLFC